MAIRIQEHSPWKSQMLVIKALLKRELITRFGKYKLGALWVLIDPLLSVIVIGLMLGPIIGRSTGDIPYPFFILSGFILLSTFSGTISSSINAIPSNQGLFVFKKVQPLDPFLARFIFLLLSNTFAGLVFCLISRWLGMTFSTEQLPEVFACVILTWLSGSGIGLLAGIASQKYVELEKVIQYIQRPLLFVSAVIYPLSVIPPEYAKYLLYNPLVHTIEYMRMSLFPGYVAEGVNLYYPAGFALCTMTLGIACYRNNRHFLTQR